MKRLSEFLKLMLRQDMTLFPLIQVSLEKQIALLKSKQYQVQGFIGQEMSMKLLS